MRASRGIRFAALAVVTSGLAAPTVRRRLRLRPAVVLGAAAAAPLALAVAVPRRGRGRDVAMVLLNMWAYAAAYNMAHDDPADHEDRAHVRYPIVADRILGFGVPPTIRLQRRFAEPGTISPPERVLVWCHWLWFMVPHGTAAYVLLRHHERFPSAAVRMYAVFDLGAVCYWAVPTAPPWWAAERGALTDGRAVQGELPVLVRRMMNEYGEQFWGERWGSLFEVFGGNPLAAMPSLHFATSLMAARLLSENSAVAGAIGWAYTSALGLALVYLGEHYAVDLLAGLALTEVVHRSAPVAEPLASGVSRVIQRLELMAAPERRARSGRGASSRVWSTWLSR